MEWPNSAQRSRTTACYSIDSSAFPSQNSPLHFLQVYPQRAKYQPPSLPDSSNRVIFHSPWHNVCIPRFDCMSLTTWAPICHISLLLSSNSSLPCLRQQILGYERLTELTIITFPSTHCQYPCLLFCITHVDGIAQSEGTLQFVLVKSLTIEEVNRFSSNDVFRLVPAGLYLIHAAISSGPDPALARLLGICGENTEMQFRMALWPLSGWINLPTFFLIKYDLGKQDR